MTPQRRTGQDPPEARGRRKRRSLGSKAQPTLADERRCARPWSHRAAAASSGVAVRALEASGPLFMPLHLFWFFMTPVLTLVLSLSPAAAVVPDAHPAAAPDHAEFAPQNSKSAQAGSAGARSAQGQDARVIRLPRMPDVAPDGGAVVFSWRGDLWLRSLTEDSASCKRITSHVSDDERPCFSPDGSEVAFMSDRGEGSQVWVMPRDGGTPRQVTTGSNNGPAARLGCRRTWALSHPQHGPWCVSQRKHSRVPAAAAG